jgi:hypothetical protein
MHIYTNKMDILHLFQIICIDLYVFEHDIHLYKERRQLKTFLTQFGSALPLTPNPPVRLHDDQKGGTTIELAIWGAFLPKRDFFLTHPMSTRPRVPVLGPPPVPVRAGGAPRGFLPCDGQLVAAPLPPSLPPSVPPPSSSGSHGGGPRGGRTPAMEVVPAELARRP